MVTFGDSAVAFHHCPSNRHWLSSAPRWWFADSLVEVCAFLIYDNHPCKSALDTFTEGPSTELCHMFHSGCSNKAIVCSLAVFFRFSSSLCRARNNRKTLHIPHTLSKPNINWEYRMMSFILIYLLLFPIFSGSFTSERYIYITG